MPHSTTTAHLSRSQDFLVKLYRPLDQTALREYLAGMAPSELPDIPHCSVQRGDDGLLHITHNGTGETETADTEDRAVIAGMVLRLTATWHNVPRETRFTAGDLP